MGQSDDQGPPSAGKLPAVFKCEILERALTDTILLTNAKANANKYVCFCVLFWHDIVKMKEVKLRRAGSIEPALSIILILTHRSGLP